MAINKLYVTPRKYKSLSDNKITSSNFEDIIKSDIPLDYQTSLGDCQSKNLYLIFNNAKTIEVHGFTAVESNENMFESNWDILFLFNKLHQVKEKVKFIDLNPYDVYNYKNIIHKRLDNHPTLWVSGCSFSAGLGVEEHECYASLLAKHLNFPLVNLSKNGRSLFDSVDQLLRADIQNNDIVILGVTNFGRYEYVEDYKLKSLPGNNPKNLKHIDLDYFDSQTNILKSCHEIFHLINFCNKANAKVIVANLLDQSISPIFFNNCENYIDFSSIGLIKNYIDIGNDGLHPGPKQHQCYFDKIYQKLIDIYPNKSYNNE